MRKLQLGLSPSLFLLSYVTLSLPLSLFLDLYLVSLSPSLSPPLFSSLPSLFFSFSFSLVMQNEFTDDSMPWSRKCESTLLRALKVVLLEGLPFERPWTVQ